MGVFTTPLLTVKDMLSKCVGFQEWLGVQDNADPIESALSKIFIEGLPLADIDRDELTAAQFNDLRPYALLYSFDGDDTKLDRVGEPSCFDSTGTIIVCFSKEYRIDDQSPMNPQELWIQAMTELERIATSDDPESPGLAEMGSQENGLRINSIRADVFGRTPLTERNSYGDAYDVLLIIKWG